MLCCATAERRRRPQDDAELHDFQQQAGAQFSTASECRVPPLTLTSNKLTTRSQVVIIIIIERKDLGGVMSKRLQGHLSTLKTVPKRECDAK